MKRDAKPKEILPYKPAKLKTGKELYVDLTYWSLIQKKYVRDKVRIKQKFFTRAEKISMLREVCDKLNAEITIRNEQKIFHETATMPAQAALAVGTFSQWIEAARKDDKVSDDRKETLSGLLSNLEEFAEQYNLYENMMPTQINEGFIEDFILYQQGIGRAGKTINKYLSAIEFMTEWMKRKKVIAEVFKTEFYRVDQPKNETGRFPPLTNEEMLRVFAHFRDWKGGYFYLFLLHVHYTCIRPAELHRLKIKNFNFQDRTIHVPWFSSKNGLSNYVQILDPLYDALIEAGADKLPQDHYLFSNECTPGTVKYEGGDYSSEVWARHRERMKLPKEKQLYGLKHTFNTNYINNNKENPDWEWLRRHNRHATIQQVQAYIAELTAYFLDQTKNVIVNYHKVTK